MSASKDVLPTTLFFIAKAEWSLRAVADVFYIFLITRLGDFFGVNCSMFNQCILRSPTASDAL